MKDIGVRTRKEALAKETSFKNWSLYGFYLQKFFFFLSVLTFTKLKLEGI